MKAAVCRAFGAPLVIEEVVLRAPGPGEVQVKLEACAICHSDILYAEGAWGGYLPAVYGHEAAGRIVATGEGVSGHQVGDRVIVSLLRACGQCRSCLTARPYQCETRYDRVGQSPLSLPDGTVLEHGLSTGGFAEAAVVHASQVAPIPDGISAEAAALLACGVITGTGAVLNSAQLRAGESAVVIGAGGVGLNAIQACRIAGASRIIAIDLSDEKLADARAFGATDALRADTPKLRKEVMALNDGRGVDHVFVTVGVISAFQDAPKLAAPGGSVVMVGMPPSGATMAVEPVVIAASGQRFIGSNMGSTVLARDIPALAAWHGQGRLKLDELVSRRYPLDGINDAIAEAKSGRVRRNVIVFDA
ncbi:MAG: Zn-dependent alcohol dehydrogenase [Pararhodobacter sp.]